jgi:hypothetical protein
MRMSLPALCSQPPEHLSRMEYTVLANLKPSVAKLISK